LFGTASACLIWNGIVALFMVLAVRKHLQGAADWRLDALIAPFLLMGAYLIYFFVRELLIATGMGPTIVEISDHPLFPGKKYELYLAQGGHLLMQSLRVLLECEEQATFRQGTDSRTDRRTVASHCLVERNDFEILPGEPFEMRADLPVPM